MTDEEYDALDEKWTQTTPKIKLKNTVRFIVIKNLMIIRQRYEINSNNISEIS